MAKKRKTREQKKLADLRHTFSHVSIGQTFETKLELPKEAMVKPLQKPITTSLNSYPYLMKDLSRTAILTIGILAFQIILFILLKNHAFVIQGLPY